MRLMLRYWAATADLLLGAACAGCDQPGYGLCDSCGYALTSRAAALTRPDPCPPGFPTTATAGPYDTLLRRLISDHKERQVISLTSVLARQLTGAVMLLADELAGSDPARMTARLCLVPVPSSSAAVRARGFDATGALAYAAASYLRRQAGWDAVAASVLQQRRGVADQAGLDARARAANMAGRLRVVRRPPADSLLILVDDVVTTGSSLTEAARSLAVADRPVLGAATVAATLRCGPRGSGGPGGSTA